MWVLLFFVGLLIFLWLVGGGITKIKAALPHYYNPFQYILRQSFSTGEHFNLPGTPSVFPTLNLASTTSATTSSDQPPAVDVYIIGSHDYNASSSDSTTQSN